MEEIVVQAGSIRAAAKVNHRDCIRKECQY